MSKIRRGLDDVTVLADLIQSPGSLRELTVDQSLALHIFHVIQLTANLGVKGGNKSTRTLRVNTLLRELELHIPRSIICCNRLTGGQPLLECCI